MNGTTLDAGALIALEQGTPRLRALVETAVRRGVPIAIPAAVLAQVWRASARQARIAGLLRASVAEVVPLDLQGALAIGRVCARTDASDVVDVSVVVCARQRSHRVVTSDPGDLLAIDARLEVLAP